MTNVHSPSSIASSPATGPEATDRCCCCTAPAATRTTWSRSAATVAPGAALLSPRGKVLENGMPRFFRRLAEGVFDEDGRAPPRRTSSRISSPRRATAYGLPAPMALGFSNGANIAAALLLLRPEALAGAVLLRAMVPLAEPPVADLAGKPVLILSGAPTRSCRPTTPAAWPRS